MVRSIVGRYLGSSSGVWSCGGHRSGFRDDCFRDQLEGQAEEEGGKPEGGGQEGTVVLCHRLGSRRSRAEAWHYAVRTLGFRNICGGGGEAEQGCKAADTAGEGVRGFRPEDLAWTEYYQNGWEVGREIGPGAGGEMGPEATRNPDRGVEEVLWSSGSHGRPWSEVREVWDSDRKKKNYKKEL